MRRTLATLLLLVGTLPAHLWAQDTAATPVAVPDTARVVAPDTAHVVVDQTAPTPAANAFHAGQWGAEFGVYSGFYGVGALRFTSPTAAWRLLATFNFDDQGEGSLYKTYSTTIGFGRQWYGPLRRRFRSTKALGVIGQYGYQRQDYSPDTLVYRSYGAGVYGELGGQVFVMPELSIGASWRAQLSYNEFKEELNGESTGYYQKDLRFNAGQVNIFGAFYF